MQRKIKLNCVSLVLALNLVAVCEASTTLTPVELFYDSSDANDINWSTTDHWIRADDSSSSGLPNNTNKVTVRPANAPYGLTVNTDSANASGGQLALWSSELTIEVGGNLTVGGLSLNGNGSNFDNNGRFNAVANTTYGASGVVFFAGASESASFTNNADGIFTSQGFNVGGKSTITNYGTMNIEAGYLYLATSSGENTWNMEGGTIYANKIIMANGGAATLNLKGGTIDADNIDFQLDSNYKIVVGGGKLEVDGNVTDILNQMKDANSPTLYAQDSSREVSVTYVTNSSSDYYQKTVVELAAIPEPAHVTLVMGLFTLLYLPLSARKVAI